MPQIDPALTAAAERIAEQLRSYGGRAVTKTDRAIQKSGQIIERAAKINAPVDTGYLRASITTVFTKKDGNPQARVGTNTHYAPYVEYGTKNRPAHPFLRAAFDENKDAILQEIQEAVKP